MPTQIQQRQIADGAINDLKITAGASIASSKLADGANFVKKRRFGCLYRQRLARRQSDYESRNAVGGDRCRQ